MKPLQQDFLRLDAGIKPPHWELGETIEPKAIVGSSSSYSVQGVLKTQENRYSWWSMFLVFLLATFRHLWVGIAPHNPFGAVTFLLTGRLPGLLGPQLGDSIHLVRGLLRLGAWNFGPSLAMKPSSIGS
jgi:hypothetical protein